MYKHPLFSVASSSANQKPTAEGGLVYRNVESWWGGTAPPIEGCFNIIILCRISGCLKERDLAIVGVGGTHCTKYFGDSGFASTSSGGGGAVREVKGEWVCKEWPILFTARFLGYFSFPSLSNAS